MIFSLLMFYSIISFSYCISITIPSSSLSLDLLSIFIAVPSYFSKSLFPSISCLYLLGAFPLNLVSPAKLPFVSSLLSILDFTSRSYQHIFTFQTILPLFSQEVFKIIFFFLIYSRALIRSRILKTRL